jgi:rRNA processing protein Krr1/Pno1
LYINDADGSAHTVIGLIIGEKGKNQKEMEQKSGCKISIRGKGALRVSYYP